MREAETRAEVRKGRGAARQLARRAPKARRYLNRTDLGRDAVTAIEKVAQAVGHLPWVVQADGELRTPLLEAAESAGGRFEERRCCPLAAYVTTLGDDAMRRLQGWEYMETWMRKTGADTDAERHLEALTPSGGEPGTAQERAAANAKLYAVRLALTIQDDPVSDEAEIVTGLTGNQLMRVSNGGDQIRLDEGLVLAAELAARTEGLEGACDRVLRGAGGPAGNGIRGDDGRAAGAE